MNVAVLGFARLAKLRFAAGVSGLVAILGVAMLWPLL